MLAKEKMPSPLVTDSDTTPVPVCFAMTLAPGRTAPELSMTVPESVCDVAPCAYAAVAIATHAHVNSHRRADLNTLGFMTCSILRAARGTASPSLPSSTQPPVWILSASTRQAPPGPP